MLCLLVLLNYFRGPTEVKTSWTPNPTVQRRHLRLSESSSMVHWYWPSRTYPISNSPVDIGSRGARGALRACNPLLFTRLADRTECSRVCLLFSKSHKGWLVQRVPSLKKEVKGPTSEEISPLTDCLHNSSDWLMQTDTYLTFLSSVADGETPLNMI